MHIGLTLAIFFGLFPTIGYALFVYWLDRYEKEPVFLVSGAFAWGAVVAAGTAFKLNSYIGSSIYRATGSSNASQITTGSLVAPIVEESLKGIAVLAVMLVFSNRFDSMVDGFVYAGITALGFAATENIYYIYTYGFMESGIKGILYLALVRVLIVGWQHPFFTAFTGIGVSVARLTPNIVVRITAPVIGWAAAVLIHSLHNTVANLASGSGWSVAGTLLDWTGWGLMALFIFWNIRQEQIWVRRELYQEVSAGILTLSQYRVASSIFTQTIFRIRALLAGGFSTTDRFFQLCGTLAHKKHLAVTLNDNGGVWSQIESIRREISALSPSICCGDDLYDVVG